MSDDLYGQLLSLLAALTFASALVLYRKSGETVPPLAVNLFKNVVAIMLFAVTLAIFPAGWQELANLTWPDFYLVVFSAVVGVAIADNCFLYAINQLGVGLMVVLDCLYSPSVVFFAWLLLGEELGTAHYVGAALVIAAVIISSWHAPPPGRTRTQLLLGILVGAAGAVMMGFGITIARPLLDVYPFMWIISLRLMIATAALALFAVALPHRKRIFAVFKPAPVWREMIGAGMLASYLCFLCWHAGFLYTNPAVAGILNQTSTIFAIVLAAIFLHERMTRRKTVSVSLALAGVMLVILAEPMTVWVQAVVAR